ncbi:Malate dehydrogenase [Geodia barretti]|uniref:Malate dehydrogenase n=1 Tax=Geodia barretti TaxID=519541 RepID=A0AA35SKR8_GEOBA|nr:Malate dehydrogenase [Geodia barretti]
MLCGVLRQSCAFSLRRLSTETAASTEYRLAEVSKVGDFIKRCLVAAGATESGAATLASTLVHADVRGHFSHGLNRLEMYCNEVKSGQCDGRATPCVVKETYATALVDGRNGIGPVVGEFSMDLAIAKAKEAGCAWVTATRSNHYGIAAHYTLRAVEEGLIVSTYSVEQLELINIVRYRCIINCIYNMTSTEIEVLFMTLTEQCPGREFLPQTLLHW